jgi:protein-tyrosine phosphatase
MIFRPVQLPGHVPGSLWLSSMPGRFGTWEEFENDARRAQLALVVCLTPQSEIQELSPVYARAVKRGGANYEWLHLPMPNFGLPEDAQEFRRGVGRIAQALASGQSVMMHCAAGLGRTGSAAACVLKALGLDTEDALQRTREAGSNPQNAQQSGFVEWF